MKNRNNKYILLTVVIMSMVLAACAPQPQTTPESSQPAATEMPVVEQPAETIAPTAEMPTIQAPATEIDVEALIIEKVNNHHDLERIWNAKFDRVKWEATIDRMIGYGAKISPEEKQIIIDYLLSRQQ